MEEKQSNEKMCKSCRYYSQHYSKQNLRYDAVCCGHCLNRHTKKYKKYPYELCEFWEDIAIKKEERKNGIKEVLRAMSKRLDQISLILKDDSEDINEDTSKDIIDY